MILSQITVLGNTYLHPSLLFNMQILLLFKLPHDAFKGNLNWNLSKTLNHCPPFFFNKCPTHFILSSPLPHKDLYLAIGRKIQLMKLLEKDSIPCIRAPLPLGPHYFCRFLPCRSGSSFWPSFLLFQPSPRPSHSSR